MRALRTAGAAGATSLRGIGDYVDEVTGEAGLVTSGMVPAFRATGAVRGGGLALASLHEAQHRRGR